jgi:hypothetical protein
MTEPAHWPVCGLPSLEGGCEEIHEGHGHTWIY